MSAFGWDYPPGVSQADIGEDEYICEVCERTLAENEIHEDCEGFEIICKDCYAQQEEERKNATL